MQAILEITEKTLINLRKQIILNSLYLNDYKNDIGIDARAAQEFFDGYLEYLAELMDDDGISDAAYFEHLSEYDTDENLLNYRQTCEE